MNDHVENYLVREGFSDYAKVSPTVPICQGNQCVKVCDIEKKIHAQLDNKVTGYSYFVGQYPKFGEYGKARISADAPETAFRSNTKITVASVSKLVTAIAAVRLIDQRRSYMPKGLDTPIANFLPSDWAVQSAYLQKLTFAQLLSQRSGIMDYGNVAMTYDKLKQFFTQSVDTTARSKCTGPDVKDPANPVNVANQDFCYSNYNFAIMRALLPKVAGLAEDANLTTRPTTLANQYTQIIQQQVFDRVGMTNVSCKPPAGSTNYAFAYRDSASLAKGSDFGDVSLVCGAAGVYLTVEDMAKVMLSLNARDNKILAAIPEQDDFPAKDLWEVMRSGGLGLDVSKDKEMEKNGGWGTNCTADKVCDSVTTSVAEFGPVVGPRVLGVLFINSNIKGGGTAQSVLENAYYQSLYTKP